MKLVLLFSIVCVLALCAGAEERAVRGHVFAWPFLEAGEMQPRGGNSQGSEVVLDKKPSADWLRLQESTKTKYAKDAQAIVAMAGSYRVSFDFLETAGFTRGYVPPKPYFSWGTEYVKVIEIEANFISLQHSLVMFFKDEDGNVSGPMTMKHWRQDWKYEDTDLHVYCGDRTWERREKTAEEMKGKWTQAVYQVDDSPRYEVAGEWSHEGGVSTWRSESCWRPLPRREFASRSDYNILQGIHTLTLTPTGWVHTQQNEKVSLEKDGSTKIVGHELGVNRYEQILEPSLEAAEINWKKSGAYWGEVREMWEDLYAKHDRLKLVKKVEGTMLFEAHFGYAMDLEGKDEPYDAAAGRAHARETIKKFLVFPEGAEEE